MPGKPDTVLSLESNLLSIGRDERTGTTVPDLLAVLEETKRKPDGTFVDGRSEKLYNNVTMRMQEMSQTDPDDPESTASCSLSTVEKNKLYLDVALRTRGRIFGVGSLQSDIEAATLPSFSSTGPDPVLQEIIETQPLLIQSQNQKMQSYDRYFEFLAQRTRLSQKFTAPRMPVRRPEMMTRLSNNFSFFNNNFFYVL